MTIPELKELAAKYGIQLHPVKGLRSHCLFHDRANKGHYRDMQLETMTETEFVELCQTAVKPPEVERTPFDPIEWERSHKRPRHILTGHFRR